jgi:general stress protein 26
MTNQDITDRIWKIAEKVGVCMLTTQFQGGMRARPLEARPDRSQNLIFFVTDARSAKDHEVRAAPDVGVVFIDPKANAFLSLTGRAQVLTDVDKASALWRKTDDVWWPDGPTDTNVRVLKFTPITAELWDGPASSVVTAYEFAKSLLTGVEPNLGENRKLTAKIRSSKFG